MTSLPPANEEVLKTDGHFETAAGDGTGESVRGSRWERAGPILTLLVLAPAIAEVLSGATRLTFIILRHISSRPGWGDLHRWALIFGAMLVCMLCGFLGSNAWPAIDLVGKVVMNLGALIWMLWFGRTIRRGGLRGAGRPASQC